MRKIAIYWPSHTGGVHISNRLEYMRTTFEECCTDAGEVTYFSSISTKMNSWSLALITLCSTPVKRV
ncbi:MAG: hypothetical protein ACI9I0_001807 [Rhodoferax sp.]|jgi:hypothetical protein